MELLAFPFQQRRCPNCASPADSSVVDARNPDSRGTSFVFYDCAVCGQLVYRILRFDIANPDGDNDLLVERVESKEEVEAVIRATLGAP
jgi:formate dehydrogenase maturation protein FdhE